MKLDPVLLNMACSWSMKAYKENVSSDDEYNSYIGCKLTMQTNNYSYKIHQIARF